MVVTVHYMGLEFLGELLELVVIQNFFLFCISATVFVFSIV